MMAFGQRVATIVEWGDERRWRLFLLVALPALAVYSSTASWTSGFDQDVFTNVVTAHSIGAEGSPVAGEQYRPLTGEPFYGRIGWFVDGPRGIISKYPPGSSLLAAPVFAVLGDAPLTELATSAIPGRSLVVPVPSFWAATAVAVVATATAVGLLAVVARELVSARRAVLSGYAMAFGTSAWGVASDQLWQHGPGLLWISAGLVAASRGLALRGGVAMALAILTRPLNAAIAAGLGIGLALDERSWSRLFRFGAPALAGLGGLVAYNWWYFGVPNVTGGYGDLIAGQTPILGGAASLGINYLGALFSPTVGFILWSPVVILGLVGVGRVWSKLPGWVRGAAIGGLLYLLLQFALNRFNPGDLIPYRYPIEGLAAAAPALIAGAFAWRDRLGSWRSLVLVVVVVWSVLAQAVAVFG